MGALVVSLLGQIWPYLLAGGIALTGLITAYAKGKAAERAKQIAADTAATSEANKIDDAVAGRAPEDNRGRLSQWSKS